MVVGILRARDNVALRHGGNSHSQKLSVAYNGNLRMRRFLVSGVLSALLVGLAVAGKPIDRKALVTRHNVTLTKFNLTRPTQVGNGEFAFGMDGTGLQTFAPYNTMSQWGWHSSPIPRGTKLTDFQGQMVDTHGRPVWYPLLDPAHPDISNWMVGNEHRINLGRIGLVLRKKNGARAFVEDIEEPRQELDMWRGLVISRFKLEGVAVKVVTACHPKIDSVAVKIESALLAEGRLDVFLTCPGNNPAAFANFVGDWTRPSKFETGLPAVGQRVNFVRTMDQTTYHVSLAWQGEALVKPPVTVLPAFSIVKAEYGANDKWIDVTSLAASKVADGKLVMRADNTLGEPIRGVMKKLRVRYVVDGSESVAEADENFDVVIDSAPERQQVILQPLPGTKSLSFVCAFSPKPLAATLPNAATTFAANQKSWPEYWKRGGAIDLSESKDPRWKELERRIVLSQYLMKVNEAGSQPPQESGLVNNGWFGRYHLEMIWWHGTHFALWDRWQELNPMLSFYKNQLPTAKALAAKQGYLGARWPKCVGPDGREWPHVIHAFLGWQQPHPIFFAELDYRAHPTRKTLEKWMPIVEATADFLSSYAHFDKTTNRYVLGPPIHLVSENTDPMTTKNPTFELGYWRFGLRTAQTWLSRLGKPAKPSWSKVLNGLAPLPQQDGLYVLHEGVKDMWTKFNFEHPAITGVLGMLPGDGVDRDSMRRTLDKVKQVWRFNEIWGWDFPMLAMSAARTGDGKSAIDYLLTSEERFQFDEVGLATGGPFPYFPSNGGLLYAVALMAAGWDGAPKGNAPGFPKDGSWVVKWEGLKRAL